MASQSIMAKFLSDDTLELNQWWEADSHLAEKYPSGVEPVRGHTLATDKIPLGSNQSGRASERDMTHI